MLEINQIHTGDCLDLMQDIPNKSVDMILCDLPYGTTACKWDTIIPFNELWKQYQRIIKDNGVIVLTASQPYTSALIMSNPQMFKEELIWLRNKSGNGLHAKIRHLKVHENILIFSKTSKYTFNPQKWLLDKDFMIQRKTYTEYGMGNQIYGGMKFKRKIDSGIRNPISILSSKVPHTKSKNKEYNYFENDIRFHPTQKPIKLFKYLIKTFSNEKDIVLDNCIGVGTTAIACSQTNRNFIGIEKEKSYVDIAIKRLSQETLLPLDVNTKEDGFPPTPKGMGIQPTIL